MAFVSKENLTRFYTKLKEKMYLKSEVDASINSRVKDVKVNGTSVVTDNVANIPLGNTNTLGVVQLDGYRGVSTVNDKVALNTAANWVIDQRVQSGNSVAFGAITTGNFDYAVKQAMCDGKGAAWTADEQAAARERMGFGNYELILDYTTTADDENTNDIFINFEKNDYTKLYIIFDESGIEGTTYSSVRFGVLDQTQLVGNRLLANTCPGFQNNKKWKTFKCELIKNFGIIYQTTSEVQLYGYCATPQVGQIRPNSAVSVTGIGGITWFGTMYAGTNIKVWGFR